jgi:hypothetical protein
VEQANYRTDFRAWSDISLFLPAFRRNDRARIDSLPTIAKVKLIQDPVAPSPHMPDGNVDRIRNMGRNRKSAVSRTAAILFAVSSTPAMAAQASAVLELAVKAAGEGHSIESGVLIETGTEHAEGLNGRWRKVLDAATGKMRDDVDFGIFRKSHVWDGQNYWRQDISGGVHPIDSTFMQETNVTDAWIASRGFLKPDAAGAALEILAEQKANGRSFDVVRAVPRGGQPVDLWFDAATHLLSRTVQTMTTYVRTVEYDDYRPVQGNFLPFKTTEDEGDASDLDVIQIDKIALAPRSDREFERPHAPDDFTIAGGKTVVPIEFDGDVIVEAKLDGQGPFGFILDTGGHDILTPAAAKQLGLSPVGAGQAGGSGEGTLSVQYARVDRMDIGGLTLRSQTFQVVPFQYEAMDRGPRPPLAGILGLELFERFAMRLDYGHKTLEFEPGATFRYQGGGTPVPIVFSDDEPLLPGKIDGFTGDVGLDTGNSGTLIVQGIWADQHGLEQRMMSGFPSLGFGAGGASPSWSSRADFEIAGVTFPGIIAHYQKDRKGTFSSRTESGNVGNYILANFALNFDYGHGRIWFEPTPGFVPPPFNRSGLTVNKERADAFKVAAVASGTPSADAGLQVGDEITAVDGTPSGQLTYWDFARAVRRAPGTKVVFSIVRNGRPQSKVVVLRELLP